MFTDTRHILCTCGEPCVEVDANISAEGLEGYRGYCDGCEAPGKIVLCDDEGTQWAEFRPEPLPEPSPAHWVAHSGLYYPIESIVQP